MSEKHRLAAAKRGADRTAMVGRKLTDAMQTILAEMKGNGGIYPHNGGGVSMAELARRAEINESTLYKKDNVEFKEKAKLWLDTLKEKETVGRKRVKKELSKRVDDCKDRYKALEQSHHLMGLELQTSRAERETERKSSEVEIEKLKRENEALREELRKAGISKVVPLKKGKD